MIGRAPIAASLVATCLLAAACQENAQPIVYATPHRSRATVVLEPPTLAVGDVATLEIAVVTPPEHRVRPFARPPEVAGFWILDSETLPVEKQTQRWIHRTRLRIRARETGSFSWPATTVEIEVPDAEVETLAIEAAPVEVISVFPDFPARMAPFGLEPPAPGGRPANRLAWAGAGAGAALSAVGLVLLARRRSRLDAAVPTDSASSPRPSWETALQDLESSRALLESDPLAACGTAAVALRRYMAERFRADALARTTEELERAEPPFAASSRWPAFVAILHRLDDHRFPPPKADQTDRRAAELIDEAERFVGETIPREAQRDR